MSAVATVERVTTTATSAPPTQAQTPAPIQAPAGTHLPGLDGLRGIAVLLVVAYHALPGWVPGGFVGVDVFFVLSGFLITTLLLRERESRGRVRLGRFWVRRVRRLVPALLAMLLVTTAATIMVGHDTDSGLRSQVAGALTWTSNWIQIHEGWSYSDQHLPPLFNHLWSLGIEEQFYVLWPLVLVAALALIGRRWSQRLALALAVGSAGLMAFWYLDGDATRAYMGLDSHAFGLLLGAAVALGATPHLLAGGAPPERSARRSVAGAVGLVVIGAYAAFVAWSSDMTFLGGLALANIAAAAVIVAAAAPGPVATALAWRPLRWMGERSYGLYLWHWPLIVFAIRLAPAEDAELAAVGGVALALLLSMVSYRYVEVPIRRDGFRATARGWFGALRGRDGRDAVAPRLVATITSIYLVLAGVAVSQAPASSEVEDLLHAGQDFVVDSVEDMGGMTASQPAPEPEVDPRACQDVDAGAPVSAFGDSVTVAIAPVLMERRPGSVAVATVGWQYRDVANAVRQTAAAGQLQSTVLIATGTNGVIDAADLDALVTNELAGRQVALVVPSVPGRSWSDQAIQAVHTVAAAHPSVHLVDWNALALANPDITASDRVHPSTHGQTVFIDLVAESLARC